MSEPVARPVATPPVQLPAPAEPTPRSPALRLARTLIALGLLAGMGGAGYWAWQWEPVYLPVRVITVDGDIKRLSSDLLQETVIAHLNRGILTQSLQDLKVAVESLPRVKSAALRRIWPDRLALTVDEHEPFARWGDDGLVTAEGVVFRPQERTAEANLPLLFGADREAPEVVRRYRHWAPQLAGQGIGLEALGQSPRGAWSLTCDSGLTVALGRGEVDARIGRFVGTYRQLLAMARPAMIDMRYGNGLAVAWPAPTVESNETKGPRTPAKGRNGARKRS